MSKILNPELEFLKSAFSYDNSFITYDDVISWVTKQNQQIKVEVNTIPFKKLIHWNFENNRLSHKTGNFFSIDGINVKTNWGNINSWDQPIINQPEIGYLGFIAKSFNGILHFLVQAKVEPGNVNHVQLSPTLQATKSNYLRVHKGKSPNYLKYFINASPDQILLDQLQSEQGARFLKKRNRNIIIKVDQDIAVLENYVWLTLAQIIKLMSVDNLVNMDTRTVISGIPFGSYSDPNIIMRSFLSDKVSEDLFSNKVLNSTLNSNDGVNSISSIINFITSQKSKFDLFVEKKPLNDLKSWNITESSIEHEKNKYFKIIAVDVNINNREVINWTQPMIKPAQEGLCAFICKEINGVLHFIVQSKLECGNFDIIELAPTVQCLTGNYRNSNQKKLPFLEYILSVEKNKIIFDTLQSEEGGRFFKEQNRNMVVFAGNEISDDLPENFIWMTLHQIKSFIKYNNYLNIQSRSLISALPLT
jgi:oxidase EvaA